MKVLIVESRSDLRALWSRHLERHGMTVTGVATQSDAIDLLEREPVDIIILDLMLEEGASFAVSDYAQFRRPDAKVIFVTNTTFFSDGSIFSHSSNASAFLPSSTPPEDLAAMVEHYGAPERRVSSRPCGAP